MVPKEFIAARRKFEREFNSCESKTEYETLCNVGFDGDWVTPYQKVSANPTGPVLVGLHWLDAKSVKENREILNLCGYLPCIMFNKVLDMALRKRKLWRRDIYVTQAFHLLPLEDRSQGIPSGDLDKSFNAVTRLEIEGRTAIALGPVVACTFRRAGIEPFECVPHPSARGKGMTYEYKASRLAEALKRAVEHTPPG